MEKYVSIPQPVLVTLMTEAVFEDADTMGGKISFHHRENDLVGACFYPLPYAIITGTSVEVQVGEYIIQYPNGALGKCDRLNFSDYYAPGEVVELAGGEAWAKDGSYIADLDGYILCRNC